MAPVCRTGERSGQKINALHDSMLQGNCSHRIRRRTATPEATFFYLSLLFSPFSPLYRKCNPSPPLKSYKREAEATSRRDKTIKQQQLESISVETTTTIQETWDLLPLSKPCNPYYERPGARQHEPQRNPLDVGPFMYEPVYILCPFCTPSRSRRADTNSLVDLFRHPVL
jgi:hypothetical protein